MDAKIFVMTHVPFTAPSDDLYAPVRVGAMNNDDFGYLRDDNGDNISAKNPMYSELTGIYDIWKNPGAFGIKEDDDDFVIGICHYRRYFSEKGKIMTRSFLESLMKDADVVTSNRIEIDADFHTYYGMCHPIGDLDLCGEVIKKLYPDYGKAFDEVMRYRRICFGNLILMRKKCFDAYCDWLFSVLFELEKKLDLSGRNAQETRVYGFLSEELLMVWLLKNKRDLRIIENPILMVSEKAETMKLKSAVKYLISQGDYKKAAEIYDDVIRVRPDVLLEASDIDGTLPKLREEIERKLNEQQREEIIIYRGKDICYNVLNEFADCLGAALSKLGEEVRYINLSDENATDEILALRGSKVKAVIGFQAKAFSVRFSSSGQYLHDIFDGPKFNYDTDNPVWLDDMMSDCPKDYYVLTHDGNYLEFIKRYYKGVKDAFLLPPAGKELSGFEGKSFDEGVGKGFEERPYDVVFMGTFRNYRNFTPETFGVEEDYRELAEKYFELMEMETKMPPEEALHSLLPADISDEEFLDIFMKVRPMVSAVAEEYRRRVIMAFLDAGIDFHVYGESWMDLPEKDDYENLRIHPEVSGDDTLKELAKAKISLNVMFWHKDGFTERVANSMMAGAALLTDGTKCIMEQYQDKKEMLIYDLKKPDEMIATVKESLNNTAALKDIARAGFDRTREEDNWLKRAELFLYYLEEIGK